MAAIALVRVPYGSRALLVLTLTVVALLTLAHGLACAAHASTATRGVPSPVAPVLATHVQQSGQADEARQVEQVEQAQPVNRPPQAASAADAAGPVAASADSASASKRAAFSEAEFSPLASTDPRDSTTLDLHASRLGGDQAAATNNPAAPSEPGSAHAPAAPVPAGPGAAPCDGPEGCVLVAAPSSPSVVVPPPVACGLPSPVPGPGAALPPAAVPPWGSAGTSEPPAPEASLLSLVCVSRT
ncbi:hypothetical protein [Yinghuangia soli]|uniref:Uncharacterized protein n=1 Tax=Yinghuangia soli TaxID=2908204 RepID=A0AA41TY96_9ACTN|nr:hypothetical protein [Yinghuangia soli]MCF2526156.1 hypothetical protein [Yinghuangia soli]